MPARRASPKPLRTYRRRKRSRSACRRKREGRCPPPPIAPHLPTDQGASAPESTHPKYRERRQRPRRSCARLLQRSEVHTSELQSLMRISYAVFCLKEKQKLINNVNNL